MKYIIFAVTVLTLAASVSAQSKPNCLIQQQLRAAGSKATVNFDSNSKVTTLKGVAENFTDADTKRSGAKAMNFAVGTIYSGEKLDRSADPLTLSFWIMSGGKARFGEDHSLFAVGDGGRADLGVGRHTFRRDGMEYLNFNLTRENIAKLAEASVWTIGGKQFTPTSSQSKLLLDVLAATQVN
jgi:hypothetical protein